MAAEEDCGLTQLLVDLAEARTRVDALVELMVPFQVSTSPIGYIGVDEVTHKKHEVGRYLRCSTRCVREE